MKINCEELPRGADQKARLRYNRSRFGRPMTMLAAMVAMLLAAFWVALPAWAETLDYKLGTYRVKRGDSLSIISQRLSTSVNALIASNGLRGKPLHVGQSLNYPIVDNGSGYHRIYASGQSLYLMTYTQGREEYDGIYSVYSVYQKQQSWTLLDRFKSWGNSPSKVKIYVMDLNQDGNDECYAFGKYVAGMKDEGAEGLFHAPEASAGLDGTIINLHVFSIVAHLIEGYPDSHMTMDRIGQKTKATLKPYQSYVERKASRLMGLQGTSSQLEELRRNPFPP